MQYQQEQDYTKKLDAGLWRRLIGYMKPYHKHLIAIMATMAVSALCDKLGNGTHESDVVFKGDVPVSRIGEGDHTVEYTLKSAADKSVWSVVAQYDGNNMLKTFAHDTRTVTAGANTVVTVTVAGAKNLKTKLLIMDPISYAPQCDARIIKNN